MSDANQGPVDLDAVEAAAKGQTYTPKQSAQWNAQAPLQAPPQALGSAVKQVLPVTQEWTWALSLMQQTVLLTAIRGPDNIAKYDTSKMLIRWLRRCVLLSALDKCAWNDPHSAGGGSFTGPSFIWQYSPTTGQRESASWQEKMHDLFDDYLRSVDCVPHHFHMHFVHAVQILGYKHPDPEIRNFWLSLYLRFCKDMHMLPEPVETMDNRLGDNRDAWLSHSDPATIA